MSYILHIMTRSYWQLKNSLNHPSKRLREKLSGNFDIAIVGAGIMGIAVAHYLKTFGCDRIIVLEKEFIGYGASGRNAGFLLSGMAEPYSRLVVGMGREWAKLLMRATIENHDLIAGAVASRKIDCNYQRPGSYHLAVSDVEKRELAESVELLNVDSFSGEFIQASGIAVKLGFGNYSGGYFCPTDGSIDPFAFVNALADGIEIAENFEVKSIRNTGGQIELSNDTESIRAEMAILATNAYTPLLDNYFQKMIFPVRGQMLAARSDHTDSLGKTGYYANFGYDYFRKSPEGTVLMGGLRDKFVATEIGYDDEINPALQKGLEDYLKTNLEIAQFDVISRWCGLMANTVDGLPLVGTLPHNSSVIAAVGCNGHGFGLNMVIARDLANAVLKNETSDLLRRFSIKRFAG
jgi:gamma-glutamylputrescine oxidase